MFCKNCGNQLDYGSPFCRYCGAAAAPAAGPAYPIAKRRSNTALIVILIVAVILLAALAGWLFLSRSGYDSVFGRSEEILIDMSHDDSSQSAVITGSGVPTAVPEVAPASETPGQDQTGQEQDGQGQTPVSSAPDSSQAGTTDYSTSERPGPEDFLWYTDNVFSSGEPNGAVPITEFTDIKGSWKAFFWYDPENIANSYGYDCLNLVVDGDSDNVSLTFDWYIMYDVNSNETSDKTDMQDDVLSGAYSQGGIAAGDPGYKIYLLDFYSLKGKQYALGYMELQSGEETYVAMVRP